MLSDFKMSGKIFESNKYSVSVKWVPSKEGVLIPLTIVHKKKLELNR